MIGLWKFPDKRGHQCRLLTLYILHSLKKAPKSGYEMLAEINSRCGNEWKPSKGTLYPLLKQLEEERYIRVKGVEARSKNIFALSAKGEKFLASSCKRREQMKEKMQHFRNLFVDVLGEEKVGLINLFMDIKETAMSKTKKDSVKKILQRCLDDLKKVR